MMDHVRVAYVASSDLGLGTAFFLDIIRTGWEVDSTTHGSDSYKSHTGLRLQLNELQGLADRTFP